MRTAPYKALLAVVVSVISVACSVPPAAVPATETLPARTVTQTQDRTVERTATETQERTVTETETALPPETSVPETSAPEEPATSNSTATEPTQFYVAGVYDGDTLRVAVGSATETQQVRVLGIDTPEINPRQCYGPEARSTARALAMGKNVQLQADPTQGDKDRYGRWLRYVSLPDGSDLAEVLLEGGYARVYEEFPVARTPQYRDAQQRAQDGNKGLWKDC